MSTKPMILVAGPYRSGTGDDPAKIAQNLQHMNTVALQVYRAGCLPVVGEWTALPLIEMAGSTEIGDAPFTEIFHPVATDLLLRCDGVLRIGGESRGADEMVETARAAGKRVYFSLAEMVADRVTAP